ncbi:MAG: glycosyltransferase [Bacteroidetes bacterium GWE2_29_8]|nr:MAG: glycosyltransferase [Bacteroidetes bacterium GWE2_29_8]
MKISIVSPVYKAEKIIPILVERIEKAVSKITNDFEIILVEDCGPDDSWAVIEKISTIKPNVIGIKLSRNFGQHNAITAGLDYAKGDWIVVMDCDLQDQPEEIEKLYNKGIAGFDIVFARRAKRQDAFFKRTNSKIFYKLFSYLTDTEQDSSVSNFGIYKKNVIDSIKLMGDDFRVFPILIQWVGFNKCYIDVDHSSRYEGKSTYSTIKLLKLAFDMIISFSEKPMLLGMKLGIIVSLFSVILSMYYLICYLSGIILVPGYASLSILITFSTGLIITFLGLVGLYIGKISIQVKERPKYIIKSKIN